MARAARRGRSARADKATRENIGAAVKIAIVVAVVGAVGFAYYSATTSHRSLNAETLCPSEPSSVTILLVDVTDPMNVAQRQDFMNQLARLKNSIPRYGKLIVTKVDATAENLLSPVIVRCNPGTAADEDELSGDPKAVQKKWDEGFDRPLQAAFERITGASGADQSPILESIQSVALTELQKPGVEGKPKRLIVASDLLQNTGDVSFYKSMPDPEAFTSSAAYRKVRTDLRGVDVELWMLERSDAAATQPRSLADLWDRVIGAQGGIVQRVYNVSG
jgi:hypothetical protein